MKRAFSIFLASFIFAVTCVPCNDQDVCLDEKRAVSEYAVNAHDHSSSELDLCSPFCVCNCCSSHISQPQYFYFTFYSLTNKSANERILVDEVQLMSYSIWQPPKAS